MNYLHGCGRKSICALAAMFAVAGAAARSTFDAPYCNSNDDKSFSTCREMAIRGLAGGQVGLGLLYLHGRGVVQDHSLAEYWLRKAAEQGDASGQGNLGYLYKLGQGVAKDDSQAAYWFRKAAEQGEPNGQANLGILYERGHGVAQDYSQAVYWYRKAAEQGQANGQASMGYVYSNGLGVAQDKTQAAHWYRKAAEQGHVAAQFNLGNWYSTGPDELQNKSQAVYWYRKAAEQGNEDGQFKLGEAYTEGRGVAQDFSLAVHWYRKAAERGNLQAMRYLADFLATGTGVEKDEKQARQLWEQVAAGYSAMGMKARPDGNAPISVEPNCDLGDDPEKRKLVGPCLMAWRSFGLALALGIGGPKDSAKADAIFKKFKLRFNVNGGAAFEYPPGGSPDLEKINESSKRPASILGIKPNDHVITLPDSTDGLFHPVQRGGKFDREFDVNVSLDPWAQKNVSQVKLILQGAADILGRCGIALRRARFFTDEWSKPPKDLVRDASVMANVLKVHIYRDDPATSCSFELDQINLPQPACKSDLLAHEFGHALDLGHPPDFVPSIMGYIPLSSISSFFTEEQCTRIRTSPRLRKPGQRLLPGSPVSRQAPTVDELERLKQSSNPLVSLFYQLRPEHADGDMTDLKELDSYRFWWGLSSQETLRIAELAHDWSSEDGWVGEQTMFDMKPQADLFWRGLPSVERFEQQSVKFAALLRAHSLKKYSMFVSSHIMGESWPALDPSNRLKLAVGSVFAPDKRRSVALVMNRDGTRTAWLHGGDLFITRTIGQKSVVVSVWRDWWLLWRGNNLSQLRLSPSYQAHWDDPAKNLRPVVKSDATPTTALRESDFGAETPASLPAARLVSATETWQMLTRPASGQGKAQKPLILSAINDSAMALPEAVDASFAAAGGRFDDAIQRRFAKGMGVLAPDKTRPIVVYCHHPRCWLGYNLGLRLKALGYTDVHWLRDGWKGWLEAALPVGRLAAFPGVVQKRSSLGDSCRRNTLTSTMEY